MKEIILIIVIPLMTLLVILNNAEISNLKRNQIQSESIIIESLNKNKNTYMLDTYCKAYYKTTRLNVSYESLCKDKND